MSDRLLKRENKSFSRECNRTYRARDPINLSPLDLGLGSSAIGPSSMDSGPYKDIPFHVPVLTFTSSKLVQSSEFNSIHASEVQSPS